MANERNLFAMLSQLFDRPCKRIQPARKQDHLVGRESRLFRIRKFEVGLDSRRMLQRPELKLVGVLGDKT